jgi:FtsP/CotA-like multicopper oxidase with cupredoxin domain
MPRYLCRLVVTAAVCLFYASGRVAAQDVTPGVTRTYYIAADEIDWNCAPAEVNHMTGKAYDERARIFLDNTSDHIGRISRKAVYREYTDGSFATLKPRPPEWAHLGLLGPVLRGEPGDTIRILFRNNAQYPFSMHPHGVVYDKASEGADGIPPGGTHTYVWKIDPRTAPRAGEPNSQVWLYHSHVDEPRDINAGLIGALIVNAKGTSKPDGTPKGIDREFVALFMTLNENTSWYLGQNITTYIADPKAIQQLRPKAQFIQGEAVDVGFTASNLRDGINGYLFGNLPGLSMRQGDRVRWYLIGMGSVIHTAHWHANTVLLDNKSTDVVPLMPALMQTADMVAQTPGTWMFHCHVSAHLAAGMYAHYTVEPASGRTLLTGPAPSAKREKPVARHQP